MDRCLDFIELYGPSSRLKQKCSCACTSTVLDVILLRFDNKFNSGPFSTHTQRAIQSYLLHFYLLRFTSPCDILLVALYKV